jgi:hypothetical protein
VDIISRLEKNCVSFGCLLVSAPEDVSEECGIALHDVQMLQLNDSAWESSLGAIWCKMEDSGVSPDIVSSAKSSVEAAGWTLEVLRSKGVQQLKDLKVPLAARFFLQKNGYCAADADQQQRDLQNAMEPSGQRSELGQTPKSIDDEMQPQQKSAISEEVQILHAEDNNDDMNSKKSRMEGGLSLKEFCSQVADLAVVLPAAETGGVSVGRRFEVCYQDAWWSGTIMYVDGSGGGILLFDRDESVEYISDRLLADDPDIRRSFAPARRHYNSLIRAVLQYRGGDWIWLFQRFLATQGKAQRTKGKVDWTLQIVQLLSERIASAYKTKIQFSGRLLGRGGFGMVVETTSQGAVKIEVDAGNPSVHEQPLWREYNLYSMSSDSLDESDPGRSAARKKRKNAKQHLPRLMNIFENKCFLQIFDKIDNQEFTLSLLATEKLDSRPKLILEEAARSYQVDGCVPDTVRLLVLNICYALQKFTEAQIAHCDLKMEHFMHRSGSQNIVVIDGGLSRNGQCKYSSRAKCKNAQRASGKFVSASSMLPKGVCLPILGDARRAGTPGLRVPSGSAEKPFEELLAIDMFAVGVCLLSVFGLVPGRTVQKAEQFEGSLYSVLAIRNFDRFLELCPRYKAGRTNGGLDCTAVRLLRLCFEMLNLNYEERITPAKALRSSLLLHPNYEQKLFEQLSGEGVIVYDETGLTPALKPLLLLYSPHHGLLLYRLLNYSDREEIGRYGGELLRGEIGIAEYSLHNVSVGADSVLYGAVSDYHSLESYIGTCCLGAFFESSRTDPDFNVAGNCYNVDRLGNVQEIFVSRNQGSSSKMSFIPMLSKRAEHGSRCSWSYSFNAGTGGHLLSKKELEEKQQAFARAVPTHFSAALAKQRAHVLEMGYRDSWTDLDSPSAVSCMAAGLQPKSLAETQESLPLSKALVQQLEAAKSLTFKRICWKEVMKNAPVLTREELGAAGIPVLSDIPKTRAEFQQAMQGQRAMVVDGTRIAFEAAETLKECFNSDGDLYSRVCAPSPEGEEKAGAAQGRGRSNRTSSGNSPPVKTKQGTDTRKPVLSCILGVIHAYCIGCASSFSNIFQAFEAKSFDDQRRRECKGHRWPRPVKKSKESDASFLDRMAGFKFLLKYYEMVHYSVVHVLPKKANVNSSFALDRTSLLLSDASQGCVQAQDFHLDMPPMYKDLAFSLLMNISNLMGYLGFLLNSGPNIDSALEFEAKELGEGESFNLHAHRSGRFRNRYLITESASSPGRLLSDVMSEKGFKETDVLRHAWSLYLQAHATDHPEKFKEMAGIWAQIQPFFWVIFDDRSMHCGPPFPMPFEDYKALSQVFHFRSVTSFRVSSSAILTLDAVGSQGSYIFFRRPCGGFRFGC